MLRVGEIAALNVEDFGECEDGGGTIIVRSSKTDQIGEGAVLYIGPATVAAVNSWLESSRVESGPLFLNETGTESGTPNLDESPTLHVRTSSPGSRGERPPYRRTLSEAGGRRVLGESGRASCRDSGVQTMAGPTLRPALRCGPACPPKQRGHISLRQGRKLTPEEEKAN